MTYHEMRRDFMATVKGLSEAAQWAEDTAQESVPDAVRASVEVEIWTTGHLDRPVSLTVGLRWQEQE